MHARLALEARISKKENDITVRVKRRHGTATPVRIVSPSESRHRQKKNGKWNSFHHHHQSKTLSTYKKKSRARDDTLRNRFQQQESISGPAPYSFSFLHIKIHAVVQSKTIDSTIQRSETIEIVGQKSRRD
jgi:hypothetical protein